MWSWIKKSKLTREEIPFYLEWKTEVVSPKIYPSNTTIIIEYFILRNSVNQKEYYKITDAFPKSDEFTRKYLKFWMDNKYPLYVGENIIFDIGYNTGYDSSLRLIEVRITKEGIRDIKIDSIL
jgi:hypothetical protein